MQAGALMVAFSQARGRSRRRELRSWRGQVTVCLEPGAGRGDPFSLSGSSNLARSAFVVFLSFIWTFLRALRIFLGVGMGFRGAKQAVPGRACLPKRNEDKMMKGVGDG